MKAISFVFLATATLLVAAPPTANAQGGRFRYLASAYADSQGNGLNMPEGIACGPNGTVVVGDTANNRLLRFAFNEKAFSAGPEIKVPQLSAPARLQLNSKGEIYALDSTARRVVRIAADGAFKDSLSFAGTPPPSTIVPKSLALDSSDNVYVLDVFSSRVLVLNPEGAFQKALPLPEAVGFGSEITVDFAGNVLLVDSVKRLLFSAGKDGAAFAPLGGDLSQYIATMPAYLTTSKGTIYVVEGSGSRIVGFGRDGSFLGRQLTMGWNEGMLNNPSQICINDRDEVFVADRDNSRIQVFQLTR
jgi:hypothetical protein